VPCSLARAHPQGTVFNYSTAESGVLGAVIAAATRQTLADYCAEKVWEPAGMEGDANWAVEADDGLEWGGLGVSARLRDTGRFGQFVLENGAQSSPQPGGRQILPPGWRDLAGQPDCEATGFGRLIPGLPFGYGYQWWAVPHVPTGIHAGAFMAVGSYGQRIYVHPRERVVVVIQSAWRQHDDSMAGIETFALLRAVLNALRQEA